MKKKYKSLKIDASIHKVLKKFCDERNLKLNNWIASTMLKIVEKENASLQSDKSNKQ